MGRLWEIVQEHLFGVCAAALTGLAGWYIGRRRARLRWADHEFRDRVNISLNTIDDGTLKIRTLFEDRIEDVFLNPLAVKAVQAAADQTTGEDPLLVLPEDEYWYFLNAVLNVLSEKFADGLLQRDAGVEVNSTEYLICLTCESVGVIRTQKIRAMVIRSDLLQNLPSEEPTYEHPHHTTRWKTLQIMAQALQATPHRFVKIELCT